MFSSLKSGYCYIVTPWIESLQTPEEIAEVIRFSNRPFVDSRSDEEKALKEKQEAEELATQKDEENYIKLVKLLPDIAPKSFVAYRRMKKTKSKNFLKLAEEAKKLGLDICGD